METASGIDAASEPARGYPAVLVVDDQAPFREAARAVLDRLDGFDVVAEAASGEAAVELAREHRPDLILMDINMGALNGIDATRIITDDLPGVLVILVSTYTVADLPASARTCGAAALLGKDELSPRAVRTLWEQRGDPDWRVLPS
jgi:DNA-binding NarL/FixJ family response regulator